MYIVKLLGMIFLAVFLILMGVSEMSEAQLSSCARHFIDLIGVAAGVLILISIGKCAHHKK